jgi:hypothetical protein
MKIQYLNSDQLSRKWKSARTMPFVNILCSFHKSAAIDNDSTKIWKSVVVMPLEPALKGVLQCTVQYNDKKTSY